MSDVNTEKLLRYVEDNSIMFLSAYHKLCDELKVDSESDLAPQKVKCVWSDFLLYKSNPQRNYKSLARIAEYVAKVEMSHFLLKSDFFDEEQIEFSLTQEEERKIRSNKDPHVFVCAVNVLNETLFSFGIIEKESRRDEESYEEDKRDGDLIVVKFNKKPRLH